MLLSIALTSNSNYSLYTLYTFQTYFLSHMMQFKSYVILISLKDSEIGI